MSILTRTIFAGYRCDTPRCQVVIELADPATARHRAEAAGWTFWDALRKVRCYCPAHGPSRTSDMVRLTPAGRP